MTPRHEEGFGLAHEPYTLSTPLDAELIIKPFSQGAYAGERLSFDLNGKGFRGNAIAANPDPSGQIRPSGMKGGLAETLVTVELRTHCTNRKGALWELFT